MGVFHYFQEDREVDLFKLEPSYLHIECGLSVPLRQWKVCAQRNANGARSNYCSLKSGTLYVLRVPLRRISPMENVPRTDLKLGHKLKAGWLSIICSVRTFVPRPWKKNVPEIASSNDGLSPCCYWSIASRQ